MSKVIPFEPAEHDPVWRPKAGGANFRTGSPTGRAVCRGARSFTRAAHGHGDGHGDRDESTRCGDVCPFDKDCRRISVIAIPPPEERGREIDWNSGYDFKPWVSELGLESQTPCHPLRRSPGCCKHDCKHNKNLTPKNFGCGHGASFPKRRRHPTERCARYWLQAG